MSSTEGRRLMVVNCLIRRRLKAPRAGRPGPTMGTPMVILASDMAPPAPASRTILQPKRVSWRCFYACFARSLRSATSAYKGPAIDLIQGADDRPLRYQVVPAILGNWGRQLSGCASRGETSARSPAQQVSADQRRTSSTIITMTAMRTIVPMPIYTTGSLPLNHRDSAFPCRKLTGPGNGTVAGDHLAPMLLVSGGGDQQA
jgi:hypothetical protein